MKKAISSVFVVLTLAWAAPAPATQPPAPAVPVENTAVAPAGGTTTDATPADAAPAEDPAPAPGGEKLPPPPVAPLRVGYDPAPTSMKYLRGVEVDGQAFLFYGATWDKDGKHQNNTYGLTRGLLNLRFNPSDDIAFRFTTDVVAFAAPGTLPEIEAGNNLVFRHAWVELKELLPFAGKLSIFGGLVDNVWNTHAETSSGLRWIMLPPLTRYGFAPESDLGVWLRGELAEGLKISAGVSNGSGATGADADRSKAVDLGVFYQLSDPLNLGVAGYVRWGMDRNLAITDTTKYAQSLTGGLNVTLKEKRYRAGFDYLLHFINDYTASGAGPGEYDTYRHLFHVISLYGVVTPIEELSGFLRFDAVVYNTEWLESYTHSGQTLLAGAAYHYNKHFSISLDFSYSLWSWDRDDPNHKARNFKGSSHSYSEPLELGLFMEGAKGVFVHTEWKF